MATIARPSSYDEACENHRWVVPERYNIAAEICDSQPADKPALVFEDFRGRRRDLDWAELRALANRAANVLAAHGVERGDRVAVCAPASSLQADHHAIESAPEPSLNADPQSSG